MSTDKKLAIPAALPHGAHIAEKSAVDQFLDRHFRTLILGVVALAVVIIIGLILKQRAHEADIVAATAATEAKTPEDCELVVAAHPGTTAAGNALLKKASLLWDQNKKDSSVAVLRDFLAKFSSHPFRVQALSSLATRLESMGNTDEAKKLYEQIQSEFPNDAMSGLAQIRLGDILWQQGKEAEAEKLYAELPRKFPGSPFFDDHQSRLEWIGAGLPTKEVEAPKPPPASLAAPAPGAAAPRPNPAASLTAPSSLIPPAPKPVTPPPAPKPAPKPAVSAPVQVPASPAPAVPAAKPTPAAPATAPATTPAPAPAPAPASGTPK